MESSANKQKIKMLLLMELLRRETDDRNCLTTAQICQKLGEMGISCERRTVSMDIDLLEKYGFSIGRKRIWHEKGYYIADRTFSIPELRLLIDAVFASKFITEEKSVELAEKLATLASVYGAEDLSRCLHVTGKPKSLCEEGYKIVDIINDAILKKKKISFYYFDYDNKKNPQRKNDGKPYTVSPYDLIWDGDYYYLTGFCDERGEVRVFRVDRIEKQPDTLDEAAVKAPRGYRVEKYTQEVFRMFATQKTTTVILLCEKSVMKAVIDMFGKNVRTKAIDADHFYATVKVCTSPNFFRWVFGWGGSMRIEGPEEVKEAYIKILQDEAEQYQ